MKYVTRVAECDYKIEILDEKQAIIDERLYEFDFNPISDQPIFSLLVDGKSHEAYVYPCEEGWQVLLHGRLYLAQVESELDRRLRASAGSSASERVEFHLKSPMPGLVVTVNVADGQSVEKGEVLIVLESMKMQNELKSPRAGTVSRLRVQIGDRVEQHQTMLSVV